MSPLARRLLKTSPAIFAVGTLGLMMLFGILGSGYLAGLTMIVGWFLLTPLSALAQKVVLGDEDVDYTTDTQTEQWESETTDTTDSESDDPVERLRERYAHGEIDEVEFERRLDTLLSTEDADPETARDRLRRENGASVEEELDNLLDGESSGRQERERE